MAERINLWRANIRRWRYQVRITGAGVLAVRWLAASFTAEQDRWFLWLPVFLGGGIGLYFALPSEPRGLVLILPALCALALAFALRRHFLLPFALCGFAFASGLVLAQWDTRSASAPVWQSEGKFEWLEGQVLAINPALAPKKDRILVAPVRIGNLAADLLPARVRLSVASLPPSLRAGDYIRVRALLYPPPGPVEPDGYDFARAAWFSGIGASGAAVGDIRLQARDTDIPLAARLDNWRNDLARYIYRRAPETSRQSAGIAAALVSGVRSYIPQETSELLRETGLAHILAISGLHMACFAGFLFFLIRAGLALFPRLVLFYPVKKWALAPALLGAVFYLMITGASIATQRAFLMFLIIALAILAGRPVVTMRNAALAALVILFIAPHSLTGASFQMSFAATIAIIAVYESMTLTSPLRGGRIVRSLLRTRNFTVGIIFTSLAAWMAVGLFAAWHFNRVAALPAIAANFLALPLFSLTIMPLAVAVLALAPFGLDQLALLPMVTALDILLAISRWCFEYLGPAQIVRTPAWPAFLAIILGALWFCFWRGGWRYAGLVLALIAMSAFRLFPPDRPDILVDRQMKNIVIRAEDGLLYAARPNTARFAVDNWLRRDGDRRTSASAHDPALFSCVWAGCVSSIAGVPKTVLLLKKGGRGALCADADIVIAHADATPITGLCPNAELILTEDDMRAAGAHALYLTPQGIKIETAAGYRGARPWTRSRTGYRQ